MKMAGVKQWNNGARIKKPGISMIERILADGAVILHFGFILFVVCGGFLLLRWKWAAGLHLPASRYGAVRLSV